MYIYLERIFVCVYIYTQNLLGVNYLTEIHINLICQYPQNKTIL